MTPFKLVSNVQKRVLPYSISKYLVIHLSGHINIEGTFISVHIFVLLSPDVNELECHKSELEVSCLLINDVFMP